MIKKSNNAVLPELLALAFIIASFMIPLFYYDQLPDQIPIHFNAKGEPDAFSGKASIWVLPVIGLAVFLLLHFISRSNNIKINEPGFKKKLTPEEKAYKVHIGRQLLVALKVIIPGFVSYIVYQSIQIGLGNATSLGPYFLIVFLTVIFGVIGYYSYKLSNPPR